MGRENCHKFGKMGGAEVFAKLLAIMGRENCHKFGKMGGAEVFAKLLADFAKPVGTR